jgi:hypothetical protein
LKKPRNLRCALWLRLSNRKKRIGNKRRGLLLKWNMIGGYSRRLPRMRVLLPRPPEGVDRMGEEEGSRGEEDRRDLIAALLIPKLVECPGILLPYGSMMNPSTLVGRLKAIRPLEVEVVDEEGEVEGEDVEDLLREEEDLMVMRLYSNLPRVDPAKHLRIEHRRPKRQT